MTVRPSFSFSSDITRSPNSRQDMDAELFIAPLPADALAILPLRERRRDQKGPGRLVVRYFRPCRQERVTAHNRSMADAHRGEKQFNSPLFAPGQHMGVQTRPRSQDDVISNGEKRAIRDQSSRRPIGEPSYPRAP